jgi:hypothetical protein
MTHYLSRTQTYYCDGGAVGCDRSYEGQGSAREVWSEARVEGWRTQKGGKHYCPKHATQPSEPDHPNGSHDA